MITISGQFGQSRKDLGFARAGDEYVVNATASNAVIRINRDMPVSHQRSDWMGSSSTDVNLR